MCGKLDWRHTTVVGTLLSSLLLLSWQLGARKSQGATKKERSLKDEHSPLGDYCKLFYAQSLTVKSRFWHNQFSTLEKLLTFFKFHRFIWNIFCQKDFIDETISSFTYVAHITRSLRSLVISCKSRFKCSVWRQFLLQNYRPQEGIALETKMHLLSCPLY